MRVAVISILSTFGLYCAASAQTTYISGDWTYTLSASNEATIIGYNGVGGDVVIPANLDGINVTQVGNQYPPYFLPSIFDAGNASVTGWTVNTSVTGLTIPHGVVLIGDGAFSRAAELTNVSIPDSVTTIGHYAFGWCDSLPTVAIPASVTSIGDGVLAGCVELTNISVDASNSVYESIDGVLFNRGATLLLSHPSGRAGNYVVPNTVTDIGASAFEGSVFLTSVIIPASVAKIDFLAFYATYELTSLLFLGTPPSAGFLVLDDALDKVVFYLPSSPGWGQTFAGRPTQVFNPTAVATSMSPASGFNFSWANTGTIPMSVRRATSVGGPWTLLATNIATGLFIDPNPPSGQAFYQAFLP